MIANFSRNKDIRIREGILKEVYEENLRIVGKKVDRMPAKPRPFFLRRPFLSIALTLAAVLIYGNFTSPPFSQEREISPVALSTMANNMSLVNPDTMSNHTVIDPARPDPDKPSDYKALISDKNTPVSRIFGLGVKTIMIDPGHGGSDSGALGKAGTQEKDITLDIAKRLKAILEKSGRYNVILTRGDDVTVPLHKRVEITAASKADLFLSIHLNFIPSKPINIVETYYFGPSSDAQVLRLAEKENAGSQYGIGEFKELIGKIGQTVKLQESREFAASIQKNLFSNIKKESGTTYDYGVKRAPFVVLLGVDVPAVLAEVTCLSNHDEEVKLNTEPYRERIARHLEAGIQDYINKGEAIYEASRRAER